MPVHSINPARLARSRRSRLFALLLLLSTTLAAECAGGVAAPAGADLAVTSSPAAAADWVTTVPSGPRPSGIVKNCLVSSPNACHTPHVYRIAYGIQPLLDRETDGRGETVTVVSPAPPSSASPSPPGSNQPPVATDIRQDLAAYDGEFGLPAARIEVVTSLAGSASPWEATGEEVGDFEILHTVAPAATLRVVLLPSDVLQSAATATTDMVAALRLAVSHTDVASVSWSLGEHYFTTAQLAQMQSILSWAAAHHVTVDTAAGDSGASSEPWWGTPDKEVSLPASDPLVLGVGGTILSANLSTGTYTGEIAWDGSGGGFSHLYARPAYQDGVPGISATRDVPDVSGAGSIPFTFTSGGKTWIIGLFGTSGPTQLWGGLMALADQYAGHDLGFINPAIYRIARSLAYHQAFHDVTTGDNTVTIGSVTITGYQAAPGWDPVTGWGSPNAQALIPLLAARP